MHKVCGLDIHKDTIFMCIMKAKSETIIQEYSTLTSGIEALKRKLQEEEVEEVAMESTGIYWVPVWRILENDFKLKLVNPYFIKQVPGRKSDVKDAQWIATVLQKGLIRGSHIPEKHIRELREYERRYVSLCSQVGRLERQIDNQLSRCNIRITSYASQTGSVTVRSVVRAIIKGEKRAEELEKHVHGRIRNKHKEKIRESLTGFITETDIFLLRQSEEQLQLLERQQKELIKAMEAICEKYYKEEIGLLCTIAGVQKLSAMQILAEIGADLSSFVKSSQLTAWAGLRPRNDESAGKIKSKKITHGNKYLRRVLVQCAWAATRKRGCWLKTKYENLCKRKSRKKALIAIARKLLVIIWHVLTKQEVYIEYQPKESKKIILKQMQYYQKLIDNMKLKVGII